MQAEKVIQKKTLSHKNSSLTNLLLLCLYTARTGEGKRYEINYFRSFLSVLCLTYGQREKLPAVICSRQLGDHHAPKLPKYFSFLGTHLQHGIACQVHAGPQSYRDINVRQKTTAPAFIILSFKQTANKFRTRPPREL